MTQFIMFCLLLGVIYSAQTNTPRSNNFWATFYIFAAALISLVELAVRALKPWPPANPLPSRFAPPCSNCWPTARR